MKRIKGGRARDGGIEREGEKGGRGEGGRERGIER